MLVLKSQHVINVGRKTVTHCFGTTLVWLRRTIEDDLETSLMAHLNQRVRLQIPHFTAAKFYTVNLATFFLIINMMTSYIVVVVQFATS